MKFKKILLPFLFILSFTFSVVAQDEAEEPCQEIDNKKAVKAYKEGINKRNKKASRLSSLRLAIELEPNYVDAHFAYAQERLKTLIYDRAPFLPVEENLKVVIEECPKYHSDPYYYLGFIAYEEEKWEDAVLYLDKFLKFLDDDVNKFNKKYDAFLYQAEQMKRYAKFYNEIYKNPVPFDPTPVPIVCTEHDEYLPMITADNTMILYTRKKPYSRRDDFISTEKEIELFSYSKRNTTTKEFKKGRRMPYPFNQNGSEGGVTMSINNKHLYFTSCRDEGGGVANCDIYFSDFIDGFWTAPAKVPGINDPYYWDTQPSLASDGHTLYFVSDRKGGYGGADIYKTVKDRKTGVWSTPENIGNVINTRYDEVSPFVHSDFQSIYFSSDGHPNVGGKDIFFARKGEDGKWQEPKNIGVPINTQSDDLGFFVSTNGKLAYFASNNPSRANGKSVGKYDIYSFVLYPEARPDEVAFFTGKVEDKSNGENKNFTVEVRDAVTGEITEALVDSTSGEYAVIVNVKKKNNLIITAKKENYAFSSQLVQKENIVDSDPVKINVEVDTIEIGTRYTLNNIYYKTNSSDLATQSLVVIDEFAKYLKEFPTIKIEVWGHTDNIGSSQANITLSKDRAYTVLEMLIEKGIDASRLVGFKGWGAAKPIASNSTEDGRAKNRRTEFMIVAK